MHRQYVVRNSFKMAHRPVRAAVFVPLLCGLILAPLATVRAETLGVFAIRNVAVDATAETAAACTTAGLVLKLYRGHYGKVPVAISGDTGAAHMAAAWNRDLSAIILSIVNPLEERLSVIFEVTGAVLTGGGRRWIIFPKRAWMP